MRSILKKVFSRLIWELRDKRKNKKYCHQLKIGLTNTNFSIISNNCWGGNIYTDLGLEYLTPTAGLFINAPCYIKFLQNLKENLSADIIEISFSKYDNVNTMRKTSKIIYPIGLINGEIEIHFLHYKTFSTAVEKWRRRAKRVNFENLFIAMSDVDNCTETEVQQFQNLSFSNKVFFSAKNYPDYNTVIHIKEYDGLQTILAADKAKTSIAKNFNIVNWLNNGR